MNINNVKKEYPKAYEKLKGYIKKYLGVFQKNIAPPEMTSEFPEIDGDILDKATETFIDIYPRMLYDFFDEQNVITEVVWDTTNFHKSVYGNEYDNKTFDTRKQAEDAVFIEAFKTLEVR